MSGRLCCYVWVCEEAEADVGHCVCCVARGGLGDGVLKSCVRGGFMHPRVARWACACAEREEGKGRAEQGGSGYAHLYTVDLFSRGTVRYLT